MIERTRRADSPQRMERINTVLDTADGFGGKTIDTLGSYVLLINNITGPGLVVLPLAYQQSGWIVSSTLLILLGVVSAVCSDMLVEAMSHVPGNSRFEGRVEFTYLARRTFSRGGFYTVLCLFFLSLVSGIISSVVESGQVIDRALLEAGNSCALELYPDAGFICMNSHEDGDEDSIFGSRYVISVGYLVILTLSIPLGLMNLDDNIIVQIISFIGLVIVIIVWTIFFIHHGLDLSICPPVGESTAAMGFLFFNYSYIITIPSWVNEKRPEVPLRSTIWNTAFVGLVMFAVVGLLGSMGHNYGAGADLLSYMLKHHIPTYARVITYFFPMFALVTSIPVFSIIMRYNLLENKICGKFQANFWSVVFPWLLSLFFYGGNTINYMLNWTGIITVGPLNFIVPVLLYLATRQDTPQLPITRRGTEDMKAYTKLASVPEDKEADGEEIEMVISNTIGLNRSQSACTEGYEALPGWSPRAIKYLSWSIIVSAVLLTAYSIASAAASDAGVNI
ncbi:hypothetical protein AAMO2058_001284300 [Amorphochlora amoebiformis]